MKTIEELLADLGDTPYKVYRTLLKGGYKAEPECDGGICRTCPVAVYLHRNGYPQCSVGGSEVWRTRLGLADRLYGCLHNRSHLPKPVEDFIRRFDGGNVYVALRADK